jgi:hypothetical protein
MMRAKMRVSNVNTDIAGQETIGFFAVTTSPFDSEGANEDNSYARWTPSAKLEMTITNPALLGQIKPDQVYYLDFTQAE